MKKVKINNVGNAGTVLITGASSGIGLEFAHIFAKENYNLILIARSEDKLLHLSNELSEKYKINCKIIPCDLAKIGAAQEIFKRTKSLGLHVDILVNNAGFGAHGFFKNIDLKTESEMIQVNITALTELTKLFLNPMLEHGEGKILNVASTAAYQPGPLMAVYYATKAYVLSFSEALANELNGTQVSVTVLCPGPTQSGFQAAAKMGNDLKLFNSTMIADSSSVAYAGYKGLFTSQRVVIPGLSNKIGACSTKFLPRSFTASVARWLQEKRN
ncbi:SDR family NAD(P)-dependent oxidoreductase [Fluviispira multicolorata]|uniref:SDR family NAD(P)-dependent oxidoreductase n=1 Tax=Fluviispira multicolorata TaxID=2654512 RepID=A0A833N5S6_9BACT|nr:SDR family oxidoreductase [Fluviispira multicolorata]KAB8033714.1 SDR family NAD(P)-dependent oxidoreductase [Fluviispira multicolorata]